MQREMFGDLRNVVPGSSLFGVIHFAEDPKRTIVFIFVGSARQVHCENQFLRGFMSIECACIGNSKASSASTGFPCSSVFACDYLPGYSRGLARVGMTIESPDGAARIEFTVYLFGGIASVL